MNPLVVISSVCIDADALRRDVILFLFPIWLLDALLSSVKHILRLQNTYKPVLLKHLLVRP